MERLYLHVGLMKTGTTYLQNVWRANSEALAEQGIWFPVDPDDPATTFAVWDLVGRRPRGASDKRVSGQWNALTEAVAARADRRVLLSEEYLAARPLRVARRAVAGFPEHEVHVVVTARDLGRVLASTWQEDVKSGHTYRWPQFMAAVTDPAAMSRDPARAFWLRQDLPRILEVWADAAGHDRVHLVTVPPPGSPPGLLLERMGSLVGFDPTRLTRPARRTNESLGPAATEVIRLINERLDGRLNQRQYDRIVKRTLQNRLPPAPPGQRLALPPEHLGWARAEAERMVGFVREHGFDVVGDLQELIPREAEDGRAPGQATQAELLDSSVQAATVLAEQMARAWWAKRRPDQQPHVAATSPVTRLSSEIRGAGYRAQRWAAELADSNRAAAAAMGVYLRVRGLGRRSPYR